MSKQPRLLDFIIDEIQLGKCIAWVLEKSVGPLTFKITHSTELARKWGLRKRNTNMTYEKLSRALRFVFI